MKTLNFAQSKYQFMPISLIHNFLFIFGLCGLFRMFYYAIGEPSTEFNPRSSLAFYTVFLCYIRSKQLGMKFNFKEEGEPSEAERIINRNIRYEFVVNEVLPVGGWINAFGICPICTGFWFYLFTVAPFFAVQYDLVSTVVWYGISLLINKLVFKWT